MDTTTVWIQLSDNGGDTAAGASNWPLRGTKNSIWEGGVRVPAFVWVGRGLAASGLRATAGTTYEGLVHVTDWLPTIVGGLLGAPHALNRSAGTTTTHTALRPRLRSPPVTETCGRSRHTALRPDSDRAPPSAAAAGGGRSWNG